jgi:DNA-directed RNA polymerase
MFFLIGRQLIPCQSALKLPLLMHSIHLYAEGLILLLQFGHSLGEVCDFLLLLLDNLEVVMEAFLYDARTLLCLTQPVLQRTRHIITAGQMVI